MTFILGLYFLVNEHEDEQTKEGYQSDSPKAYSDVEGTEKKGKNRLVYLDRSTLKENFFCSERPEIPWPGTINRKCQLEGKLNCTYLCCGKGYLQRQHRPVSCAYEQDGKGLKGKVCLTTLQTEYYCN